MVRFIDRTEEKALLQREWKSQKNAFVVVFGRRRIGKTRLINEFIRNKEGIKYTAEDANKKIQLNEFKKVLASYLKDDFLEKQDIADWASLFLYLSKIINKEKKIFLWIDEFSYIVKNDPAITSIVQKFVDDTIRNSQIFFVVSGSLFGLMSEKVLSSSSPLYGRRTRDILLKFIPAEFLGEFINFSGEDLLKTFFTISGIPEYLIVSSKYKSYREFVANEFLTPEGYFYREPFYLLSQEFKEIKTYFSILNAIAYGNSKPTEIANFVGINTKEIYPYLELLIAYDFVKRETSILGDKKRGIYYINDTFFDFWFNFVQKNREKIDKREYQISKQELSEYMGKRFEIFIRENFSCFINNLSESGRWWHKDKEIDILGLNETKKEILFGECKWSEDADALEIVKECSAKSKYVKWNNDLRKESFAIFAKSFKRKISEFEGKKVFCFDLGDITKLIKHRKTRT